ncbi:PH and SEC7 domain-containing protein 4-like isoform X2 [Dromaius novaehollandiae]|uniref:PH and SEC7 domain-containing protein 4-like isoform X2 n=1 Tax=Dromaius novaehollandiae TaxID=8790 RepID=UPI00311E3BB8
MEPPGPPERSCRPPPAVLAAQDAIVFSDGAGDAGGRREPGAEEVTRGVTPGAAVPAGADVFWASLVQAQMCVWDLQGAIEEQPAAGSASRQRRGHVPADGSSSHEFVPVERSISHEFVPVERSISHQFVPADGSISHEFVLAEENISHEFVCEDGTISHEFMPAEGTISHEFMPAEGTISHKLLPAEGSISHKSMPAERSISHEFMPAERSISHEFMPAEGSISHEFLPAERSISHEFIPVERSISHEFVPAERSISHEFLPAEGSISHKFMPAEETISHEFVPAKGSISPKFVPAKGSISHEFVPAEENISHEFVHEDGSISHVSVPADGNILHEFMPVERSISHEFVPAEGSISHKFVPAEENISHEFMHEDGSISHVPVPAEGSISHEFVREDGSISHEFVPAEGSISHGFVHEDGSISHEHGDHESGEEDEDEEEDDGSSSREEDAEEAEEDLEEEERHFYTNPLFEGLAPGGSAGGCPPPPRSPVPVYKPHGAALEPLLITEQDIAGAAAMGGTEEDAAARGDGADAAERGSPGPPGLVLSGPPDLPPERGICPPASPPDLPPGGGDRDPPSPLDLPPSPPTPPELHLGGGYRAPLSPPDLLLQRGDWAPPAPLDLPQEGGSQAPPNPPIPPDLPPEGGYQPPPIPLDLSLGGGSQPPPTSPALPPGEGSQAPPSPPSTPDLPLGGGCQPPLIPLDLPPGGGSQAPPSPPIPLDLSPGWGSQAPPSPPSPPALGSWPPHSPPSPRELLQGGLPRAPPTPPALPAAGTPGPPSPGRADVGLPPRGPRAVGGAGGRRGGPGGPGHRCAWLQASAGASCARGEVAQAPAPRRAVTPPLSPSPLSPPPGRPMEELPPEPGDEPPPQPPGSTHGCPPDPPEQAAEAEPAPAALANGGHGQRAEAQRLAARLFHLDGFKRSQVAAFLRKNNDFSGMVAQEYLAFFQFGGQTLDRALRAFLQAFVLTGETQERERILGHFSRRYHLCNPDTFPSPDAVHSLTCAIMLLNTDLHGQNIGRAMTSAEFVANLSGMMDGQNFPKEQLKALYNSIRNEKLEWAADKEEEEEHEGPLRQRLAPASASRKKSNPFVELPRDADAATYRQGLLARKVHAEADGKKTPWGKRGWKTFHTVLKGMVLYFLKGPLSLAAQDESRPETPGAEEPLGVHHALAERASKYTKRPNVFRLQTADWRVFLFQAPSAEEMSSWISRINLVAALFSSPPFPAAVSSQRRFIRPILPAAPSRSAPEEQHRSHETCMDQFAAELFEHQRNLPDKRGRARDLDEYRLKKDYLLYEKRRYETYVQLLETWLSAGARDLDGWEAHVGPVDAPPDPPSLTKAHSSPSLAPEAPPAGVRVKRNISERRTVRKIVPKRNKNLL